MWDLIVSVPDHCLSFNFTRLQTDKSIGSHRKRLQMSNIEAE